MCNIGTSTHMSCRARQEKCSVHPAERCSYPHLAITTSRSGRSEDHSAGLGRPARKVPSPPSLWSAAKQVPLLRTGLGYLPLMPGWRALLPGIEPAPLTASVVFQTPLIRDLVSWAGFRQACPPLPSCLQHLGCEPVQTGDATYKQSIAPDFASSMLGTTTGSSARGPCNHEQLAPSVWVQTVPSCVGNSLAVGMKPRRGMGVTPAAVQ